MCIKQLNTGLQGLRGTGDHLKFKLAAAKDICLCEPEWLDQTTLLAGDAALRKVQQRARICSAPQMASLHSRATRWLIYL